MSTNNFILTPKDHHQATRGRVTLLFVNTSPHRNFIYYGEVVEEGDQ